MMSETPARPFIEQREDGILIPSEYMGKHLGDVAELSSDGIFLISKYENCSIKLKTDHYDEVNKVWVSLRENNLNKLKMATPNMTTEDYINQEIKDTKVDTNFVSDGYHTFGELYEHRIILYMALCKCIAMLNSFEGAEIPLWRSKVHSDGSSYPGWFLLGIHTEHGEQISYHLPDSKWEDTYFATSWEKAPDFDGHTSADVLERIKRLL